MDVDVHSPTGKEFNGRMSDTINTGTSELTLVTSNRSPYRPSMDIHPKDIQVVHPDAFLAVPSSPSSLVTGRGTTTTTTTATTTSTTSPIMNVIPSPVKTSILDTKDNERMSSQHNKNKNETVRLTELDEAKAKAIKPSLQHHHDIPFIPVAGRDVPITMEEQVKLAQLQKDKFEQEEQARRMLISDTPPDDREGDNHDDEDEDEDEEYVPDEAICKLEAMLESALQEEMKDFAMESKRDDDDDNDDPGFHEITFYPDQHGAQDDEAEVEPYVPDESIARMEAILDRALEDDFEIQFGGDDVSASLEAEIAMSMPNLLPEPLSAEKVVNPVFPKHLSSSANDKNQMLPKQHSAANDTTKVMPKPPSAPNATTKVLPKPPSAANATAKVLPKPPSAANDTAKVLPKPPSAANDTAKVLPKPPSAANDTTKVLPKPPSAANATAKVLPKPPSAVKSARAIKKMSPPQISPPNKVAATKKVAPVTKSKAGIPKSTAAARSATTTTQKEPVTKTKPRPFLPQRPAPQPNTNRISKPSNAAAKAANAAKSVVRAMTKKKKPTTVGDDSKVKRAVPADTAIIPPSTEKPVNLVEKDLINEDVVKDVSVKQDTVNEVLNEVTVEPVTSDETVTPTEMPALVVEENTVVSPSIAGSMEEPASPSKEPLIQVKDDSCGSATKAGTTEYRIPNITPTKPNERRSKPKPSKLFSDFKKKAVNLFADAVKTKPVDHVVISSRSFQKSSPPISSKALTRSKPVISVKSIVQITSYSSPRRMGRQYCEKVKFQPNIHDDRGPCELCYYHLSPEEKAVLDITGHHLRVMNSSGGCDRSCKVFPREPHEPPVRLCRTCFFNTHREKQKGPTKRRVLGKQRLDFFM